MCWDVDILHWPDTELVNANYWSCLSVDLTFDPPYRKYLQLTHHLRSSKPAPTGLPMRPENMPYYRGPRIQKPSPDIESAEMHYIQGLLSDLLVLDGRGNTILSNHPVRFEQLQSSLSNTGSQA